MVLPNPGHEVKGHDRVDMSSGRGVTPTVQAIFLVDCALEDRLFLLLFVVGA